MEELNRRLEALLSKKTLTEEEKQELLEIYCDLIFG